MNGMFSFLNYHNNAHGTMFVIQKSFN